MFKTKSAKNVSGVMLILGLVGYIFGTYYVYSSNSEIFILINYTFGLFTSSVLCYLWFLYKDR